MSIDRIQQQLSKMKLTAPDDERSVTAMRADNWIGFGDASGDTTLIALHDDVSRQLGDAACGPGKMSHEIFWSGSWLNGAPFFKGFDEMWNGLTQTAYEATMPIQRSSERQALGRVKKLGKDFYLLEAESGDYALVPVKDTKRWRLE